MQTLGTKRRLASFAVVALLALAVVPALASTASAASVASSVQPAAGTSTEWAYGGAGWASGGLTLGQASLTWNATAGAVVIYNATNTSATTTELSAQRTVMVRITASLTTPNESWTYNLKLIEVDHAYANLTDTASVTLANSTVVPALGIVNASMRATVSLQASLVGTVNNKSASAYLNASGWANAQVGFSPALGLVPLNLSGVTRWTSSASATGSAAWNISWAYAEHALNGTSTTTSGFISGTWSTETEVALAGHVCGVYAKWVDHRVRTGINLVLTGPFDLYGGILLVPHAFDLFGGARADASSGLGTTTVTSENLYIYGPRHVSAQGITAANLNASASTPVEVASAGPMAPAAAIGTSAEPAVWENPESPGAAQSQAYCFEFGCSGSSNPWGLVVSLAIAGVAAAVVVGLVVRRRGRGGPAADIPLSAQPTRTPTSPPGVSPPGQAPPTS